MKILCIVLAAFVLSGCILDRFWTSEDRGPSTHERLARLGLVEEEDTPADEQYKYHFNFWRAWTGDLVEYLEKADYLDGQRMNRRRVLKTAVESRKHLKLFQKLLTTEEQENLDAHYETLGRTVDVLNRNPRQTQLKRLAREVSRERRTIDKQYRYSRAKQYIDQARAIRTDLYEEDEPLEEE